MAKFLWSVVAVALLVSVIGGEMASAQNCGRQAGGKTCGGGLCCSQWGWCGSSAAHCGSGCQSGCRRAAVDPDAVPVGGVNNADPDATAAGNP